MQPAKSLDSSLQDIKKRFEDVKELLPEAYEADEKHLLRAVKNLIVFDKALARSRSA